MSLTELERGSEAAPPAHGSPVGSPADRLGPVLGVDLDYEMTLEQAGDLFRLAAFLRHVIRAQGMTSTQAKRAASWGHLGSLLALTEARRPTLATLERFAAATNAPPGAVLLLAAEVPHAIAPNRELGT